MKFLRPQYLIVFVLMLSACTDEPELSSTTIDMAYSSQVFNPTEQVKTHQLAAFVVPTDQAGLSFQVSGIIEEQYIKIGDSVASGQQLFKISNPSLKPQIQQFNSQIDAIKATLEQNQAEVNRFKDLKKTNAISQNELDRLTHQNENLKATKKSIEAQLDQAQSMYEESFLKAPFAGNVAEIYKEAGEVISPGELVLVIGGVNSLEAPIFLPSFLHKNLKLGQQLTVNYNQNIIEATVKEISQTANPKSQLFKVMLDVPIKYDIKSGEKITVQIKENMGIYYKLPVESVIDDGINQPFIFTIKNQQVIQTGIELLEIIDDEAIVHLNQNQAVKVVTAGQNNLSPQQQLAVQ